MSIQDRTTSLNKLNDAEPIEDKENVENLLDEDNLSKTVSDLSISVETRLLALVKFSEIFGEDGVIELINKLGIMYEMSGTKSLRDYLYQICMKSKIKPFYKTMAAKALCVHDTNDTAGSEALVHVYPQLSNKTSVPFKMNLIRIIMENDKFREHADRFFREIINTDSLESEYRYRMILSLEVTKDGYESEEDEDETEKERKERKKREEKEFEAKKERMNSYIRNACQDFLDNKENQIIHRILAGQYLVRKYEQIDAIPSLLEIAEDNEVEYNLRADAADVVLQTGTDDQRKRAEEVIRELGSDGNVVQTIYENAQNVHHINLNQDIDRAIGLLSKFDLLKMTKNLTDEEKELQESKMIGREDDENQPELQPKKVPIDFEFVKNRIKDSDLFVNETTENQENILISLNRIYMDRATYGTYSYTLTSILLKIWTYIHKNKHEDEMKKRLFQELKEMVGTCSSGFASRLINTISGFGEFNFTISWRDQIISNVKGRLGAKARDIDDLDFQEKVLEEMVETGGPEKRPNFLQFMRSNIMDIEREMWQEFKEHLSEVDFALYFRTAVSMFETGEFV